MHTWEWMNWPDRPGDSRIMDQTSVIIFYWHSVLTRACLYGGDKCLLQYVHIRQQTHVPDIDQHTQTKRRDFDFEDQVR